MSAARSPVDTKSRHIGLAAAVTVHVVIIAALLSYTPVRKAIAHAAPIMVTLIAPPPIEKPIEPPKPLPIKAAAKPVLQTVVQPALLVPITPAAPLVIETPTREIAEQPRPFVPAPPSEVEARPQPTIPPNFSAAYLDNPPPPYPAIAKRAGEQGKVILRVLVTTSGTAEAVELKASSGSQRLDHAALETVKRWRFVPARQGDHAVAAWVLVPINFTLQG